MRAVSAIQTMSDVSEARFLQVAASELYPLQIRGTTAPMTALHLAGHLYQIAKQFNLT